ncbi:MAG: hypothetical protein KA138_10275, partial [Saprospiraceae bacterium]|nr:hypothetical protein [Saprospiraceae bacterium]
SKLVTVLSRLRMHCISLEGSIRGICANPNYMFSFEKYRKRYLLQLFLDIGFTCSVALLAVLFSRNDFQADYFIWTLGSLVFLGLLRLAVLLNWLLRSIVLRNVWLSIFSGFHLVILGVCLWWALFVAMIFAGMIGITQDGTEYRY